MPYQTAPSQVDVEMESKISQETEITGQTAPHSTGLRFEKIGDRKLN